MARGIVLETSHGMAEIALADETGVVRRQVLAGSERHVRDLAPGLAELLREAAWPAASVEVVLVDVGPGSYTGLRTGIVTAKAFAYAVGAKVVGVDAMTLLGAGAPKEFSSVSAIIDAQQGNVYGQRFGPADSEGERLALGAIEVLPAQEWVKSLTSATYVTGPALTRFEAMVPEGVARSAVAECGPTVEALWRVGWKRYLAGLVEDVWSLEPLYLRASSAELKWNKRLAEKEQATPE